jgi:hypothetical protein
MSINNNKRPTRSKSVHFELITPKCAIRDTENTNNPAIEEYPFLPIIVTA